MNRTILWLRGFATLLIICLVGDGDLSLYGQMDGPDKEAASLGVKQGVALPTEGKDKLRTDSAERVRMIKARIMKVRDKLQEAEKLSSVKDVQVVLPPFVSPEKPPYPAKPKKKDTASSLKIGEFETEEQFKTRVSAAQEKDAKDFRFAEIEWRLRVQNIDDTYEKTKAQAEKDYDARKIKERERLEKIKSDLPGFRKLCARQISQLERLVHEEESNLESLLKNSSEAPLTGICVYTQLPFFDRKSMSFLGVNITCPELKRTIKDNVYSFIPENIALDIEFTSLVEAQRFKDLSENGKLFACLVSDISYIETLVNFQETSYALSWGENYRVTDTDLLRRLWKSAIGREKTPPSFIPNSANKTPVSASLAVDASVVRSNAPVRIYFGTATTIFDEITVKIRGDFMMKRLPKRKETSMADGTLVGENSGNITIPGVKAGERRVIIAKGIEYAFRWCPPGMFNMGIDDNVHEVTLTKGFWLLETEVTQEMYQSLMGANPSVFRNNSYPVEFVSWNNCLDFCDHLTKENKLTGIEFTLPTEAQWEYACRAGTTSSYSFGNELELLSQHANYCEVSNTNNWSWRDEEHNDGFDKTAPVKSFKPNPWGLYDMHGNVWEWCSSRYGTYPRTPELDPIGPISGTFRVFRGGSWGISSKDCRSGSRFAFIPQFRRDDIGFRVCLVPQNSESKEP